MLPQSTAQSTLGATSVGVLASSRGWVRVASQLSRVATIHSSRTARVGRVVPQSDSDLDPSRVDLPSGESTWPVLNA